jgi:hypothetical protein
MCYTWPSSLAFAVVGWLTTAGLLARGRSVAYVLLPAFFAAMEVSGDGLQHWAGTFISMHGI